MMNKPSGDQRLQKVVAVPEAKRKGAPVLRKAGTLLLAAVAVQVLRGPNTVNAQQQNQNQSQPILFRV